MARQPAEWSPHAAVWTGWPSHAELWGENLGPAREEVTGMIEAIRDGGRGEPVILLAADPEAAADARARFADPGVRIEEVPFGDIWFRDTGPILTSDGASLRAAAFAFNGWGGKYVLEHDTEVAAELARRKEIPLERHGWVLEGGAIDVDGTGRAITTEECLLNPNRNPGVDRSGIEARLRADLGLEEVIWLGRGLAGDHTDGHVDNLARFVGPGTVIVPEAAGGEDPNHAVYEDAARILEAAGLLGGRVPSPGRVESDGRVVPASYMNFFIGNSTVVVPQYGTPRDREAVERIGAFFPGRRTVGVRSVHLLTGGGSFHCITQQLPRMGREGE